MWSIQTFIYVNQLRPYLIRAQHFFFFLTERKAREILTKQATYVINMSIPTIQKALNFEEPEWFLASVDAVVYSLTSVPQYLQI